jgi:hypothetical protein
MTPSEGGWLRDASERMASGAEDTGVVLLRLPPTRSTFAVLVVIALVLFGLTYLNIALDQTSDLLRQFDTGDEANVPTWFSSMLWLTAAGLAGAVGAAGRRLGEANGSRWLLLALGFALLSLDEAGQLHEETVGPLMDAVKDVTGLGQTPARLLAVAVVGIALVAIAAWLWPWLRTLPRPLFQRLVLAGAVFVSGSLVLEVIARLADTKYLSPFEELGEMIGVALLLTALMPCVRGVLAQLPATQTGGGRAAY